MKKHTCHSLQHITVNLQVRRIHELAKIPIKARSTDAGYDLFACKDAELIPSKATIVYTGIIIACPPGFYYTIEGRSSLWLKGIFPNRGIIDSTYTGEVVVSLVNVASEIYKISACNRIAQIILHRQYDAEFEEVTEFDELYSERGTKGFGSTGV